MKRKKTLYLPSRQHGVAAISLAALLVAITAMLLVSQRGQVGGSEGSRIEAQLDAGQWARDAIDAFAFSHARLPCPSASPNGGEACDGRAKGWLPTSTLESFGVALPAALRRQPVSYMVYKGAGIDGDPDLTVLSDRFQPLVNGETAVSGHPEITTLMDLCQKLQEITPPAGAARAKVGDPLNDSISRPDRAQLTYQGLPRPINVAYALAVSQNGKPFLESAANADMRRLTLEAPDRAQSQEYSEQVVPMPASDLFKRLGCASVMVSLDALASANSFTATAVSAREGNISTSDFNVKMGAHFVATDTLAVSESLIDLVQSPVLAAENALLQAIAAAGLPFTLSTFLNHAKGIVDALAGVVAAHIPLEKNTLNLVNNTWQLGNMLYLQQVIQDSKVWADPSELLQSSDNADAEIVPDVTR